MLSRLVDAGFTLAVDGEVLQVHPADKLTDEQCRFIRNNKSKLMDEVRAYEALPDNVIPFPDKFACKQSPDLISAEPLFPKACKPRLIKPAIKTRLAQVGEFGREK